VTASTAAPAQHSSWLRPFGSTGLTVSAIGMGGAQLGSMPELFGYEVSEQDAIDLIQTVLDSPIRLLDTSNGYGGGRSEQRIGQAVRGYGGLPPNFVISTKVDADGWDYSGARVRASVQESAERLELDRLPIVFLHDPEFHAFDDLTVAGGAVDTLVELQRAGRIGHLGVAGGDTREIGRYVDLGVFDAVLVHNRWTLVDRSADFLFTRAAERGMAVVNAAVYGGGLLTPSGGNGTYAYVPARPEVLAAAAAMAEVCRRHGTDLSTAALQFSLRDPRVTITVTGFTKLSTMTRTLAAVEAELPESLWSDLDALTPDPGAWLDNNRPITLADFAS
jgi:D-threo-aldose 1-dehydrogenase